MVTFVSDERPMALKNSCGVEIVSVPGREGVSRWGTPGRSRSIPCVWGTGREAARFTRERERRGRMDDSICEGEPKPVKNVVIFNELSVTSIQYVTLREHACSIAIHFKIQVHLAKIICFLPFSPTAPQHLQRR